MAKAKETAAPTGPQVGYGPLMENHDRWASEEHEAAQLTGERRQAIGAFADKHGINNKAMSQVRAGLKLPDGKRQDWLRSLEMLLPLARIRIMENGTQPMDLGEPEPAKPRGRKPTADVQTPVEPASDNWDEPPERQPPMDEFDQALINAAAGEDVPDADAPVDVDEQDADFLAAAAE